MYSISELIEVILFLTLAYNVNSIMYELIDFFPNMREMIHTRFMLFNKILDFILENKPLLIYYDDILKIDELKEEEGCNAFTHRTLLLHNQQRDALASSASLQARNSSKEWNYFI